VVEESYMRLLCVEGKNKDSVWELKGNRTLIGRDAKCDIVIDDSALSRIHAEIVREENGFVLHDKNSSNGSYINGDRVRQQVLLPDDQIEIGKTKIEVLEDILIPPIEWQEEDTHLVTSVIPLDTLSQQLEKAGASSEIPSAPVKKRRRKTTGLAERLLKNLETVYEVGNAINAIQSIDQLLDRIAEKLLDTFIHAERICILLRGEKGRFEPKSVKYRATAPRQSFHISRSIVKKAVKEQVCIAANDAAHDARFSAVESIIASNLRSFMCAPLATKGTVLGLCYLDNREKSSRFDENDVALLSALANQSATAIENSRLHEDLQKAYHESIVALMNTVEAKDAYTRGHSRRTSRYALGIAQEMKLHAKACKEIRTAAELHDIGKIGIRDPIIGKDSALSTMEFQDIQSHVFTGENILKPVEYLRFALPIIRHHHEHYDGSGYPDGLKGDEIPLGARIVGVADAFDAMTTQRPYNEPLSTEKALEELEDKKGKQFDPDVVDALSRFATQNLV
jgi:HD-GYP domain-containing protein (c-di-GMP phosphodiesterase class II)/pSer/pThr/pTyr-binding forkhead associated (FHA) protein